MARNKTNNTTTTMRYKGANILSLTKEQIEYRNSILKKKTRPKVKSRIQEIISETTYMNNCIFWINEYYAGRADKARAISAIDNLKIHLDKLKTKIK